MAEQQKRLIYSNPPQRRNTSNQLEKVLSQQPSSERKPSNAAQTPPRPHSTMVDHDKFARMRLGSLPDTKTSSSKLSNFGKRVNAAKKFFEKAPKWMTKQSSSSSTTSAQQNPQNPYHQQQVITTTNSVPAHATAYPTGTQQGPPPTTSPSYDFRRHSQAGSSDTVELQSPQKFGYSPHNGQKQQYTRKSSGDYRAGYQ